MPPVVATTRGALCCSSPTPKVELSPFDHVGQPIRARHLNLSLSSDCQLDATLGMESFLADASLDRATGEAELMERRVVFQTHTEIGPSHLPMSVSLVPIFSYDVRFGGQAQLEMHVRKTFKVSWSIEADFLTPSWCVEASADEELPTEITPTFRASADFDVKVRLGVRAVVNVSFFKLQLDMAPLVQATGGGTLTAASRGRRLAESSAVEYSAAPGSAAEGLAAIEHPSADVRFSRELAIDEPISAAAEANSLAHDHHGGANHGRDHTPQELVAAHAIAPSEPPQHVPHTDGGAHECSHDDPSFRASELTEYTITPQRYPDHHRRMHASTAHTWAPIRVTPQFEDLDVTRGTDHADFLRSKLVPQTIAWVEDALRIRTEHRDTPLQLTQTCRLERGATSPSLFRSFASYDTDFLLVVYAGSGRCGSRTLAWAQTCVRDEWDRPIVGLCAPQRSRPNPRMRCAHTARSTRGALCTTQRRRLS